MSEEGFQKAKIGYFVLLDDQEYVIDSINIGEFKAYLRDMEEGRLKPISIDKLLEKDKKSGKKPIIAKTREELYKQQQAQIPRERLVIDSNLPQDLLKTAKKS